MAKYNVLFEDPLRPDEPLVILVPADEWLNMAMAGDLPPVEVYWRLQEYEEKHTDPDKTFYHDPEMLNEQHTAPRIGPLTEEEAMEYLIMKDVPRHIWSKKYNRPMLKIVKANTIPSDQIFRNAWRLSE